jgi:hypothetical protein
MFEPVKKPEAWCDQLGMLFHPLTH